MCSLLFLVLVYLSAVVSETSQKDKDLLVLTVATQETDGFKRYMRSARVNGLQVTVLGMGQTWEGGDIKLYAGGGHKVNLMKEELAKYKDDKDRIVLFTDSYDVVVNGPAESMRSVFLGMDCRVLFSAEGFCWPDKSLASQYPAVEVGKTYLNSGAFMGYASDLYSLLTSSEIKNSDDDQLFYTRIYLDKTMRERHSIKLDHKSEIFQNLNGATADLDLRFKGKEAYLQNTAYNTVPLIIHGNGGSKTVLNTLGSYLGHSWNPEDSCVSCWDNMVELDDNQKEKWPKVLLAFFVEIDTPFLEEFMQKILDLEYSKSRIDLFLHNAAPHHEKILSEFVEKHGDKYNSVKEIKVKDNVKEWHARNLAIETCMQKNCDLFFSVDAEAHLDNIYTLKMLIEQNRDVLAPMMIRPYKAWSNFWGALTADGFYSRSIDYMDIVEQKRRGVWNVPYITGAYLIKRKILDNKRTRPNYVHKLLDADMAFCQNMRDAEVFLYVTNRAEWGHLVSTENFDTSHLFNEMWQLTENRWDWEQRYLHPNYSLSLQENSSVAMPCPDVFWFPIVTERFTKELILTMENYGTWSDGTSHDSRLDGGYENVPTRDIHMKQINYENEWLYILREYVKPLQEKVFIGYHSNPPRATMNFVVKYRPEEQSFLRPHHDSSTYTINLALNRPKIDYQGGGCRFVRYNCSVTDMKMGWMLMHPGRLTHFHEGLPTTGGTRYIMISFVDP